MPESQTHPEHAYRHDEHYDEIDLADVVLAIWRRRWLFVGTFLAVFGLSAAYAFLATPSYEYRTTLEIGYVPAGFRDEQDNGDFAHERIESAQSVKDRIERLYIPAILHNLRDEYEERIGRDSVKVSVPEESGIVVISREAPESGAERTLDLLSRIIERVTQDHDRTFDLVLSQHQQRLTGARNQLEALKSQESVIRADLERLDRTVELVKANIENLEQSVARMQNQRGQVATMASNEEKAMTLLLIDNQIQNEQRRLEQLRERLEVELERQRDQLQDSLGDNLRAQENQTEAIATLESRGETMQRTEAVIPPSMSLDPVGPGKHLILALGFVMAGMLAVLAVGVSGLVARARRKKAEENSNQ